MAELAGQVRAALAAELDTAQHVETGVGLWDAGAAQETEFAPRPVTFARLVAARVADTERIPGPEHASDLWLVSAIEDGDEGALRAFESGPLAQVRSAVAHLRLSPADLDEVEQRVRTKLLVREAGDPTALWRYAGRGDLAKLVRVSATRVALNMLRDAQAGPAAPGQIDPDHAIERLSEAADDPELAFLKRNHQEQFKEAFAVALQELAPRDRTVLRLQLIDGLSIDEIAGAHEVHRATAARWLQRAREQIATATRRTLQQSLRLDRAAMDRVLRLIRSRLDLSISRLLASHRER